MSSFRGGDRGIALRESVVTERACALNDEAHAAVCCLGTEVASMTPSPLPIGAMAPRDTTPMPCAVRREGAR